MNYKERKNNLINEANRLTQESNQAQAVLQRNANRIQQINGQLLLIEELEKEELSVKTPLKKPTL